MEFLNWGVKNIRIFDFTKRGLSFEVIIMPSLQWVWNWTGEIAAKHCGDIRGFILTIPKRLQRLSTFAWTNFRFLKRTHRTREFYSSQCLLGVDCEDSEWGWRITNVLCRRNSICGISISSTIHRGECPDRKQARRTASARFDVPSQKFSHSLAVQGQLDLPGCSNGNRHPKFPGTFKEIWARSFSSTHAQFDLFWILALMRRVTGQPPCSKWV